MTAELSTANLLGILDVISAMWVEKAGNKPDNMLPKEALFGTLIGHLATCRRGWSASPRDEASVRLCENLVGVQREMFGRPLLKAGAIRRMAREIRNVPRRFPRHSWEWRYGKIIFGTSALLDRYEVNANVLAAVGLLVESMSNYEYPTDLMRVLALKGRTEGPTELPNEDEGERAPLAKTFEEYWAGKSWERFEQRIRAKHPVGTNVWLSSYYITSADRLDDYLRQRRFRKRSLDKVVRYLRCRPETIIDLSYPSMMAAAKLSHGQLHNAMFELAQAGVIGAKVRYYYIGPVALYLVSGELKPPGEKVRRRVSPALRRELLERARYRCQVPDCLSCGNRRLKPRQLHVDHLMPFSIFRNMRIEPDANPENLRVLCAGINRWKSDAGAQKLLSHRPIPPSLMTMVEWHTLRSARRKASRRS